MGLKLATAHAERHCTTPGQGPWKLGTRLSEAVDL